MNNKFIELAKQAGAAADHGVTGVDDENFLIMSGDEIEKFAELIVKETLQVARAGIEYGPSMEEVVYKYFGIE